jgi:predicted nicotinamide N-methyase
VALSRLADPNYSVQLVSLLSSTHARFLDQSDLSTLAPSSHSNGAAKELVNVLQIICDSCLVSAELTHELACDGLHPILSKLLKLLPTTPADDDSERLSSPATASFAYQYTSDYVDDIHSTCYSIASACAAHKINFPSPPVFVDDETRVARQPRAFNILDATYVIGQVSNTRQTSQEDVGFVMWPSSIVLSLYISRHADLFAHRTVLELGAGCGLTGMVAGRVPGVKSVTSTDYNDAVLENLRANVLINDLESVVTPRVLDFYQQRGTSNSGWLPDGEPVDVVIAADVICKDSDAGAAARSVHDCLKSGGRAYVVSGTGEHRFGVDLFNARCKELGLKITTVKQTVEDILELSELEEESRGKATAALGLCAGFVEEMTFYFHVIEKV